MLNIRHPVENTALSLRSGIMDSNDKRSVALIENCRARLQTLIRVEPVLDLMHSIDKKQKELIMSKARAEGERQAVHLLIDTVIRMPRAPGWFQEFLDALSAAGCRHAADYMDVRPPSADLEAENDNHIRLIELLSASLLDMKTCEVSTHCLSSGILTAEDVEKVSFNGYRTQSSQSRNVTKRKNKDSTVTPPCQASPLK